MKTTKKPARGKIRILIIDDHPMTREGLNHLVANESDLTVCGEAGNAQEGFDKVNQMLPDLVLSDITLPDKNGLELIKDLLAFHPRLPILVISMHDEALYVDRILRAGGRGYVMKQEGGKKILEAIRKVLAGEIAISEKMSVKFLEAFSGRKSKSQDDPTASLTDREFEIFQLIAEGGDTKEIAAKLHLSPKTVEAHRSHIKIKLSLRTMPELIRYAVRWAESQNLNHP